VGFVVTFYVAMLLPHQPAPITHEEKVATLEECIGMVADFELRARALQKTGTFQAGCHIEIPRMENP
jgi:hypothetical protein